MSKILGKWLALAGAPGAWLVQVVTSTGMAGRACYPHSAPLPAPAWPAVSGAVMGLDAACLAAALGASFLTLRAWRRTASGGPGDGERAIETGETRGGFLVMLSALSNAVFVTAIVVTGSAVFLVNPCRP